MRQELHRFIALMILMPLLGWTHDASADGSVRFDSRPVESHVELPRTFQGVRLGMGRVEVLRTRHNGSLNKASRGDVVVLQGQDRYVKRVEYDFYNGTLYSLQAHYRSERIPGGVDALVKRLKETYGPPVVDGAVTFAPAPGVLSEKRIVWSDGRTEIAFVEQERDIETNLEVVLLMADLELAHMKEAANREQQRQQIRDVPIPMPDGSTSNRTATGSAGGADHHAYLSDITNHSS